jgi:hypothetical protein
MSREWMLRGGNRTGVAEYSVQRGGGLNSVDRCGDVPTESAEMKQIAERHRGSAENSTPQEFDLD